jgi:hypothetical protein
MMGLIPTYMKKVVQNFKPTPFDAHAIYIFLFLSGAGQANAVGLSQVN